MPVTVERKLPLPSFFVIGAAKSGTSALWHALRQHPDIQMSPVKEPCFFLSNGRIPEHEGYGWDFLRQVGVWRPGEYAMLFAEAGCRRALGEASTPYLTSPAAAARIHARLPTSRIIAILRQPADRAYSAYNFSRQIQLEPEGTFQAALTDQGRRISHEWAPVLLYQWSGHYHAHLQPWFGLFPRDRIRVCLYEDWQHHPHRTLTDLFRFLEVDDRFQPNLERRNVTRLPRLPWLYRLAHTNRGSDQPASMLRVAGRQWLHSLVRTADTRFNRIAPPPLDPGLKAELTRGYRDDLLKLEQLLDRDLSPWLAGT